MPSPPTPATTTATATSLVAWGSNLFGQLHRLTAVHQHANEADFPAPSTPCLAAPDGKSAQRTAAHVVAASWSQLVVRTQSGRLEASGSDSARLQKHLDRISSGTITGLGYDALAGYLDADGYLHLLTDTPSRPSPADARGGKTWTTAATDARGRVLALDASGDAHLFPSLSTMQRHSTHPDPDPARYKLAFPHRHTAPAFRAVSAGWSHFLLLSSSPTWPVWVCGDTRFGVVPLRSRLSPSAIAASAAVSEPEGISLVPVEFFSSIHAGFPAGVVQVAAGGRHCLVRTDGGDVYGWGWNGDGQLCRAVQGNGEVVSEPVLLVLNRGGTEEVSVVDVACGASHSILVGEGGELWVAGSNEHGQLGLVSPSDGLDGDGLWRPDSSRHFSQIKPTWRCSDGPVRHPAFGPGQTFSAERAVCSSWSTIVTVVGDAKRHGGEQNGITN